MKKDNIILIGMMGAGKTTVANYLSEMLPNYKMVDVDSVIEDAEGLTIPEIFEMYTEIGFRRIESLTIEEIANSSQQVISTGGGAFENEENRKVLLNSGKVFYLYAPAEVLYDRIKTQSNRPLLQCENPEETFRDLLDKRDSNYRKADYIIDTGSLSPELVAKEILRRVNETVNIGWNSTGRE